MNAFTHNRHGLVRVPWRVAIYLVVLAAILTAATIMIVPLVDRIMGDAGDGSEIDPQEASLESLPTMLVSVNNIFLLVFLILAAWIMVRFFDHRPLAGLGLGFHGRWVRQLSAGLILAMLFISLIVFIQMTLGAAKISSSTMPGGAVLRGLGLYLLLFITVGVFEEFAFRGYLMQLLAEGVGKWGAALITSIPFGIVHYYNSAGTVIGAISTGAAGLLLAYAYFRTRSLWLPIGMHVTWNFTMAWVYGLPVSGEKLPETFLSGEPVGPEWLSGGGFGPEGSVLAFLGMGALALLIRWAPALDPTEESITWTPPAEERGAPALALARADAEAERAESSDNA